MLRIEQTRYQLPMTIIHPGEFMVTKKNEIVATVLGSCVSVVLFDPESKALGMNHFMLAKYHGKTPIYADDACRYGMYAMEQLINAMLKSGISKDRLLAKVFGGGHVIGANIPGSPNGNSSIGIPESNIQFAFEFLALENIKVVNSDVGGYAGRKIMAFAQDAKVLLKRLKDSRLKETIDEEENYLETLRHTSSNKLTLFQS